MTNYRPICDVWLLARTRTGYYGAYPYGFLQRARDLIGCGLKDRVLHVCSGAIKKYPFSGYGSNDRTVDINGELDPDYVMDVSKELPKGNWEGVLVDTPYSEEEAKNYGDFPYPEPNKLLRDIERIIEPGIKVGVLHYFPPRPPKTMRLVALVAVMTGYKNRVRVFSVFEKKEREK